VITIATSPLCWIHYYMLVLIPAFWLLSSSSRPAALLAALGVLLSAGTVGLALRAAGLAEAAPVTIAASWVPLWAALLVVPGRDGAAPAGQAATAGGPRPRRRK
jgi:hypothetical protein